MSIIFSDTLLQHWKSSVSWSAANNLFPRGWFISISLVLGSQFFQSISDWAHLNCRFLHYVTIHPFWTEVKHKVCSGKKNEWPVVILNYELTPHFHSQWRFELCEREILENIQKCHFLFQRKANETINEKPRSLMVQIYSFLMQLAFDVLQCGFYRASLADTGSNSWASNWGLQS